MAVVMELGGSGWRSMGKEFVAAQTQHQSSNSSSSKSADSSFTSGACSDAVPEAAAAQQQQQLLPGSKKRGWGQDLHKAVQLMLGQVPVPVPETLDLLGISSATQLQQQQLEQQQQQQQRQQPQQAGFLELEPNWVVPAGWEKCLDLRSGAVFFQNRSTGAKTYVDPRQQQHMQPGTPSSHDADGSSDSRGPATTPPPAVNFFASSKSASPSASPAPSPRATIDGSAGSGLCLGSCLSTEMAEAAPPPAPWALEHWAAAARGFSERNPFHHHHLHQHTESRFRKDNNHSSADAAMAMAAGSHLDLKLSSCGADFSLKDAGKTSVCTSMEKVREALLRTTSSGSKMLGSRLPQHPQQHALPVWSRSLQPASPSDSSSSASASSSTPPSNLSDEAAAGRKRGSGSSKNVGAAACSYRVSSPGANANCVSSSSNVSSSPSHPSSAAHDLGLGLGSSPPLLPPVTLKCCKNCFIYVMLSKEETQCPRCHNSVLLDFSSSPASNKKPKLEVMAL